MLTQRFSNSLFVLHFSFEFVSSQYFGIELNKFQKDDKKLAIGFVLSADCNLNHSGSRRSALIVIDMKVL